MSSRIVAVVLASLLAVGSILVTPMTASADPDYPDRSISGSVSDNFGNPVTSGTVTLASTSDAATILDTVLIDESGAYTFEGVAPGYYLVSVASPGFETNTFDLDTTDSSHAVRNMQLVPLPCSTGCTLSGSAYSENSEPVASGTVDFFATSDLATIAASGTIDSGTWWVYGLAAGDYVVRFSAPSYRDLIYGDQSAGVIEDLEGGAVVTVSSDSGFDVTMTKTPTTTVSGVVRTSTSATPRASVLLERFVDETWVGVVSTSTFSGSYSFENVVPGTYRVTADSSTYKIARKTITVATSPVTVPVIILAAAPLRTITVGAHIANTTDAVEGLTISAYLLNESEHWDLDATSTSGSFSVHENATYRFVVSDPSHSYKSISVSSSEVDSDEYAVTGDPTDVLANYPSFRVDSADLTFGAPLYPLDTTTGYVTYFGTPVEGAIATFTDGERTVEAQTGADGSFNLYLPEGTFEATVTASGYDTLVVEGDVVSWGYNGQPDSFTLALLQKTLVEGELGTMTVPSWSISQTSSSVSISTEEVATDPTDAVRSVSWTRDGESLDETGDSVALSDADAGFTYAATITYSDNDYFSAEQTLVLTADGLPVPEGSVQVSEIDTDYWVAELPSSWPSATYSYQWLLDGAPVDGATDAGYSVQESNRGAYLSVLVNAAPVGYDRVNQTSDQILLPYKNIDPIVEPSFSRDGDVLTGDVGLWPAGTDISSGWIGETFSDSSTEHSIQAEDYGQTLTFRVVASSVGSQRVFDVPVPIDYLGVITSQPVSISVGEGELTAVTDGWEPGSVEFSYTWTRDGEIVGESATYGLTEYDLGRDIVLTVTGTKVGYVAVNRTDTVFIPGGTMAFTPAPVVVAPYGLYPGSFVYALVDEWSEVPYFDYTWNVDDQIVGHDWYYYPATSDFGHDVTVTVTGTATGFDRHSETSEPLALPLLDRSANGFTIQPELEWADEDSQVAEVGQELSLNLGDEYAGWSTISWYRDDSTEVLATGNGYTVTAADLGSTIRAVVTGAAGDGYAQFESSASVALYGPPTDSSDVELSVTGDATLGGTLTAQSTGWPDGTVVRYEWRLGCCDDVLGSELEITRPLLGDRYRLYAYGKQPGHTETRVRLDWTDIDRGMLTQVEPTTFSSERAPGETITATPGTYSDDVSDGFVTYQWLIGSHLVGEGLSYDIQSEDRGSQLTLRTLVEDVQGYENITFNSTVSIPLGVITAGTPTITGTAVLTATTGTWAADVTLSTRWLRNGVVIPGDTGLTHTVVAADQGGNITFEVAAAAPYSAGTTVSVSTAIPAAVVTPVVAAPVVVEKIVTVTVTIYSFTATPVPTISGSAKVGSKLSVKTAAWKPSGVALAYQWYAGGKAIAGATGKTLKLVKSVSGKKITVRVTGTKAGYATATVTSKATKKVKK